MNPRVPKASPAATDQAATDQANIDQANIDQANIDQAATDPCAIARPAPVLEGFAPVADARARVLILGSFPGVASLAAQRYYAHPRNQFWSILESLTGAPFTRLTYPRRLASLRRHHIALWDIIEACTRQGSLDARIRDPVANAFDPLLDALPHLRCVAFNGAKAASARAYFEARGLHCLVMPSTSPAHAARSLAQKEECWRALLPWLQAGSLPEMQPEMQQVPTASTPSRPPPPAGD